MEDFNSEKNPLNPPVPLTPGGHPQKLLKASTGYPYHQPGGRFFAKGHPKLGGKKKGYKHFKTRFMEEMENTAVDSDGRTVRNDLAITRKAIEMARNGDLRAIEFIIERLDGKVPTVIAGDEKQPLQIVIESVISERYNPQQN